MEIKLEDPKDIYESSLEVNFGKAILPNWKSAIFNTLYNYIPKINLSEKYSYSLIALSFLQLFAQTIMIEDAKDPILGNFIYFRLFPGIEYARVGAIYYVTMGLVSIWLLLYSFFIFLSLIFKKGWGMTYICVSIPVIYWIGIIPITEMYIAYFRCDDGFHYIAVFLECSNLMYYIMMPFVIIMIPLWICIILITTFVSAYSNPHSSNHFSHFPWNFELIYMLIRIVFVIENFLENYYSTFHIYFQWAFCIIASIYFISLIIGMFPYYNPTISWLFGCSILIFSIYTMVSFLIYLLETFYDLNEGTRLIFFLVIFSICIPCSKVLRELLLQRLMSNQKLESQDEIDMQAYCALTEFVTKKNPMRISNTYMEGYLEYLKKSTKDASCPLFSKEPLNVNKVFYDESCEEGKRIINTDGRLRYHII